MCVWGHLISSLSKGDKLAVNVLGVTLGTKTLTQIVAPLNSIISELQTYNEQQNAEAAKQSSLAQEALRKQVEAEANAKLASAQASRLQELIIV
jgi:Sec-independent protein translocase protein TatA